MNLKDATGRGRDKRDVDTDVNLTGVMNIFLILIPFLLLTTVFVHISALELTLPNLDRKAAQVQEQKQKPVVLNFLFVRETEFELRVPELTLPKIAKKGNVYDWDGLIAQLQKTKEKYPESEDIILSPEGTIRYDTIINLMDRCREAGFSNISISG